MGFGASGFRASRFSGFRVWGLLGGLGDFLVSRLATGVLAVPSTEVMGKSTESRGWAKVLDIGDYNFRIFKTPKP